MLKELWRWMLGKDLATAVEAPKTLRDSLQDGVCPDCGGDQWYLSPQGGAAQNIECGRVDCGSKFNLAPMDDGVIYGQLMLAERISEPKPKASTAAR